MAIFGTVSEIAILHKYLNYLVDYLLFFQTWFFKLLHIFAIFVFWLKEIDAEVLTL